MLYFLFALCRRLHQPMRLAVVVTPLALLVCCALAVHALDSVQQTGIQIPAIAQQGDHRAGDSSTGRLQGISVASVNADQAACCVPTAAWHAGKSQLARRIAERCVSDLLVSSRTSPFEPSLIAGPTMPRVFDASSPEYLTLRQLRL